MENNYEALGEVEWQEHMIEKPKWPEMVTLQPPTPAEMIVELIFPVGFFFLGLSIGFAAACFILLNGTAH